ncbi:MAG: VOC family protein [Thermoleophilaceae bacterium]
MAIDAATTLGAVRLNVADLPAMRAFYERVIGLTSLEGGSAAARLGAGQGAPLVELIERPDAPPRPPGTTGLFHLAILVPDRRELARALERVASAGWRLTGASDHLVSEALYLDDPEGNGIELYRDRPREEWSYEGGTLQMATLPLDLEGLAGELQGDRSDSGMTTGTRIGHVHLQVADLDAAESFYHGILGFDVSVRSYPGALFVSAGGYHHHIGLNTWAGEGAPPPPAGARGLRWFEVVTPEAEVEAIAERARGAGLETARDEGGVRLSDPSSNGVVLRAPNQT